MNLRTLIKNLKKLLKEEWAFSEPSGFNRHSFDDGIEMKSWGNVEFLSVVSP